MNSTAFSSNDFTEPDCYKSAYSERNLFLVLYIAIIVVGIPANVFSLIVSWQHIRQNNELGVYLLNLALSDLFFIMCLPVWVDFLWHNKWRYNGIGCFTCVFLLFTNFYTSVVLLCCIALDRYLAVVHPLRFPSFRRVSTAVITSLAAWILTTLSNAASISLLNIYDKDSDVCLDVLPLSREQRWVFLVRFCVGFFLPAALVGFCCWRICVEIQSNRATGAGERRRALRLMGAVLLTLWLCFGPVHVAMLLRAMLEDCPPQAWIFYPYKVGIALASLNCLADPMLYCFITRTGRQSFAQAVLLMKREGRGGWPGKHT